MSVKDEFGTCCIFSLDLMGFELDGFFNLHQNFDGKLHISASIKIEATKLFRKYQVTAVDAHQL